MQKFRREAAAVVEAVCVSEANRAEIEALPGVLPGRLPSVWGPPTAYWLVPVPGSVEKVVEGDWIIRVNGQLHTCQRKSFEQIYEPIEADTAEECVQEDEATAPKNAG